VFTVDASVHINAMNPAEPGSADSQAFVEQLHQRPWPVFSPTLLLVEVASGVARAMNDTGRGIAMAQAIHDLPGQIWITLDDSLTEEAIQLATEHRLRGADAVYAAVARRYGTTLVTWDRQQLNRLRPILSVLTPTQALERLAEPVRADKT
jgi:predicted nucleic acid-binding protein